MTKKSILTQFIAATMICATTNISKPAMGQEPAPAQSDIESLIQQLSKGQKIPNGMADLFGNLQKQGLAQPPENTVRSSIDIEGLRQQIQSQMPDSTQQLETIRQQIQLRERQAYNGMTLQEFRTKKAADEKARIERLLQDTQEKMQRLRSQTQQERTALKEQKEQIALVDRQERSITKAQINGVTLTLDSRSKTKGMIKLAEGDKQIGMGTFSCREDSVTLMMSEEGLNYMSTGPTTTVNGATITNRVYNNMNLSSATCSGMFKRNAQEMLNGLCAQNVIMQCSPNAGTDWSNTERNTTNLEGATYGNWCGGCWSGGMKACNGGQGGVATPLDSMDEICKQHDIGQAICDSKIKDRTRCLLINDSNLATRLSNLSEKPQEWSTPPRAGSEEEASSYRKLAIKTFHAKIAATALTQ